VWLCQVKLVEHEKSRCDYLASQLPSSVLVLHGDAIDEDLFVEENVHPQCNRCNTYLSGNVTEYERFIVKEYGEKVLETLRNLRHIQHKYTRDQLADMRDQYKKRIKLQERRLG
jgi:hypothetical protein